MKFKLSLLSILSVLLVGCSNNNFDNQYKEDVPVSTTEQANNTNSDNVIDVTIDTAKEIGSVIKSTLDESGVTNAVKDEVNNSKYVNDLKDKLNKLVSVEKNLTLENTNSSNNTTEWSYELYPKYYNVLGQFSDNVENYPTPGNIKYSSLDNLGRTQSVYGNITHKMIMDSKGFREKWAKSSEPSGWYSDPNNKSTAWNKKVELSLSNGKTYRGWFYNRSHLLADSLGGAAIRENAITGTRMQNVGNNDKISGIQYIEMKVYQYILANPNVTVLYGAQPIYSDNELVPRKVIVYALSSDGTINETVETFNNAKDYQINYQTGEFFKVK